MTFRPNSTRGIRGKKQDRRSRARWLSYAAATGAAAITGAGDANAVTLQFPGAGSIGADGTVALDLNGDNVDDVTIANQNTNSFYGLGGGRASAGGSLLAAFGAYATTGQSYLYALKFSNFSSITPDFAPPSPYPSYYKFGIYAGNQGYVRDGYGFALSGWGSEPGPGLLGVRFDIGGDSHMGFVELLVDASANDSGLPGNVPSIISYGYETLPDTALSNPVPEPTSLGLLAAGAAGLATLRRRRRSQSQHA